MKKYLINEAIILASATIVVLIIFWIAFNRNENLKARINKYDNKVVQFKDKRADIASSIKYLKGHINELNEEKVKTIKSAPLFEIGDDGNLLHKEDAQELANMARTKNLKLKLIDSEINDFQANITPLNQLLDSFNTQIFSLSQKSQNLYPFIWDDDAIWNILQYPVIVFLVIMVGRWLRKTAKYVRSIRINMLKFKTVTFVIVVFIHIILLLNKTYDGIPKENYGRANDETIIAYFGIIPSWCINLIYVIYLLYAIDTALWIVRVKKAYNSVQEENKIQ